MRILVNRAIELDPHKSLKENGVNRFTQLKYIKLTIPVQLMHDGIVTDFTDVPIPRTYLPLEELLPLVKDTFNVNVLIEGCYNTSDSLRIENGELVYAGQQI